MFILVQTAISYGESIVDCLCSPTPSVPIVISSSQSPLLSITPVRCMDTANFINVKVPSMLQLLEAQYESQRIIHCLNHWRDLSWKPSTRFFDSTFKNSLTFASYTKTMQNGVGEVAKVSYCYYSRDSYEIVQKFPCMEVAKFTDHDQTFGMFCLRPRADVFGRCALQRVN